MGAGGGGVELYILKQRSLPLVTIYKPMRVLKGCNRESKKQNNINNRSTFSGKRQRILDSFFFLPPAKPPQFDCSCRYLPLSSTSPASDMSWAWPEGVWQTWRQGKGHHSVSLQWQSSLYICLLSRGISCWPKLYGCPRARHLQYCNKAEDIFNNCFLCFIHAPWSLSRITLDFGL